MDDKFLQILEKTSTLYKKYGLKSISMDDVAVENGVSKKTLYKYVSDKNDLIRKIMQYESKRIIASQKDIFEQNLNAIEEVFAIRPIILEMIKKYNPVVEFDLKKYHPDIFNDMINIKAKQIHIVTVRNLHKGIQEGLYRQNINVETVARIRVVTEINRIQADEDIECAKLIGEEALMQVIEYHLRAICSPKGLTILEQKLIEIEAEK